MTIELTISAFLKKHVLPESFRQTAEQYFIPLAQKLCDQALASTQPIIVGINGCQGSGKSTLTDLLVELLNNHYQCPAVGMSIDDFYLTKASRQHLASEVHPLFVTRGVPGTHDVSLMMDTLYRLKNGLVPTSVPVFDKSIDDRASKDSWPLVSERPKIILFEGWCISALAQNEEALASPINEFEASEDPEGAWRSYANRVLHEEYQAVFSMIDRIVMLQAPGFHTVKRWRTEQEHKLRAKLAAAGSDVSAVMTDEQVLRFIQHYERITDGLLNSLPQRADDVFELNDHRQIIAMKSNEETGQ